MTDLKTFITKYESLSEHGQEEFRRRMHKPTGKGNSEERKVKQLEEELERMTAAEREAFRHQIQDGGKKFKDPDAPKKPSNAYIHYSKTETERLKSETEGLAHADAFSLAASHWKALSEDERQPWEAMALADKERYEREIAAYKPSPEVLLRLQSQVGKKKRAKRDPNHPKQGSNAYILYSVKKRAELKEAGLNGVEARTEAARLWGQLSDKEKKPFVTLAEKDKARYEKEMQTYKKGESQGESPEESEPAESPKKKTKTSKKTKKV